MCLVQVTGVLCFFLLISNVMYVSSSVIYGIRMAGFQFIAEGEYFFFAATAVLSFIQFFAHLWPGVKAEVYTKLCDSIWCWV